MFKKIVFLITGLFFNSQTHIHAMYATRSWNQQLKNPPLSHHLHRTAPSTITPSTESTFITTHGICAYKPEHFDAVKKIAAYNVNRLTTVNYAWLSLEACNEAWQNALEKDILPIFEYDPYIKKVYLIDGVPIGFITYTTIKAPVTISNLFLSFLPKKYRQYQDTMGYIAHLAIDQEYQGKGYGSDLIKSALQDFEEQSVDFVTLTVTIDSLVLYYKKFGFEIVDASSPKAKSYAWKLAKRLTPHPITKWLNNREKE